MRDRKAELFKSAVEGLQEFYPCLKDQTLCRRFRDRVQVPDTGDDQLDYENVRDQVERFANEWRSQ